MELDDDIFENIGILTKKNYWENKFTKKKKDLKTT
jgi:hypothetical protein